MTENRVPDHLAAGSEECVPFSERGRGSGMNKKPDQKWVAIYRNQGRNNYYEHGRIYLVRVYRDEGEPRDIPRSGRTFRIWWEGRTHWVGRGEEIRRLLQSAQATAAALNREMREKYDPAARAA